MNLRTGARLLIAISLFFSGLAETLSATGLTIEFSPDASWKSGSHIYTLALGGALQMAGAALSASGRKTRWAFGVLLCYVFVESVFGNLPRVFNPDGGGSAIAGLLSNMAVIGGLLYCLHGEWTPGPGALPARHSIGTSPHIRLPLAHTLGSETQPRRGDREEAAY